MTTDNNTGCARSESRNLKTPRLDMQWLSIDDAQDMLSIWNDPAFIRHVGDREIRTVEKAEKILDEGLLRQYERFGYGPYKLILRETQAFAGICGIFRRETLPDPDIGFALLPEYCGRGLAGEAATAVTEQARNVLELPRLTAIVSPGNRPSIKLIERLGLKFDRLMRMPGDDADVSLYAVDWPVADE